MPNFSEDKCRQFAITTTLDYFEYHKLKTAANKKLKKIVRDEIRSMKDHATCDLEHCISFLLSRGYNTFEIRKLVSREE